MKGEIISERLASGEIGLDITPGEIVVNVDLLADLLRMSAEGRLYPYRVTQVDCTHFYCFNCNVLIEEIG